jgi:hypothetical protein
MAKTVSQDVCYEPPAYALRVLEALESAGFEAWIVGGWVRDALLGLPPHDVDICTSALWQQTEETLRAAGIRVEETGTKHGTVTADQDSKIAIGNIEDELPFVSLVLINRNSRLTEAFENGFEVAHGNIGNNVEFIIAKHPICLVVLGNKFHRRKIIRRLILKLFGYKLIVSNIVHWCLLILLFV